MAALALMTAACSNSDNDILTPAEQPAKAEGIPFTATISVGESGTTRALSESGSTLVATWAVDDEGALIHNGVKDVMTVASVSAGVATITGTITGSPADGDPVTIIYPATAADGTTGNVKAGLLTAQDGTLADVASKYDVRKGTGELQVSGDPAVASLNGNVSLNNQFAIWKLTLANNAKNLCIMADNITIAGATLGTEGKVFTVAVPAVSSKTVTIVANDASNNCYYFSKAGVSLAAGTYYQSSPTMTALDGDNSKPLYKITATSGVTIPDGKTVVLSGVNISGDYITCNGNATIILMGDNTVSYDGTDEAAIKIGGSGSTLTITGSGSLTAQGGENAAGIGTDYANYGTLSGGNIVINGGTVNATGGNYGGAGIGTGRADNDYGYGASITCGDITINGGTVTAQGGDGAAGIGTGLSIEGGASNECGKITIGTGVISVTATKGTGSPNSIGKGDAAGGTQTCGTITIGGDATTYAGGVTTSPFTYPTAP